MTEKPKPVLHKFGSITLYICLSLVNNGGNSKTAFVQFWAFCCPLFTRSEMVALISKNLYTHTHKQEGYIYIQYSFDNTTVL